MVVNCIGVLVVVVDATGVCPAATTSSEYGGRVTESAGTVLCVILPVPLYEYKVALPVNGVPELAMLTV